MEAGTVTTYFPERPPGTLHTLDPRTTTLAISSRTWDLWLVFLSFISQRSTFFMPINPSGTTPPHLRPNSRVPASVAWRSAYGNSRFGHSIQRGRISSHSDRQDNSFLQPYISSQNPVGSELSQLVLSEMRRRNPGVVHLHLTLTRGFWTTV